MYFECNLPHKVPAYIHKSRKKEIKEIFDAIRARHAKLEEALTISGLDGETFSEYARVLFKEHFERFEEMTPDQLAMYVCLTHRNGYKAKERLEWPNAIALMDCAFVATKEWEAIRHIGIGGSDAAVVQGISPYKTAYGLYHDKRWTPKNGDADDGKDAIFARGHYMEDAVIDAFCKLTGAERIPETRMFQSKKFPACTANPDAIVRFPNGNISVFEAKTTVAENYEAWSGGKIPPHYIAQTRQYPAVLDDSRLGPTYIGCLFTIDTTIGGFYVGSDFDGDKFVTRHVDRDVELETDVLAKNQAFYDEHLKKGSEPELNGSAENNKAAIAEVVGIADSSSPFIELEETFRQTIADFLVIKEKQRGFQDKADALKAAADNQALALIARLGTTVEGRLPVEGSVDDEYYEVKYAPRKQNEIDLERLRIVFPDAFEACVRVNPCHHRVFTITKKKPRPPKRGK